MRRSGNIALEVFGLTVGFGGLVLAVALIAQGRDGSQWKWDDWAAAAVTSLVGLLFGLLAYVLQHRQSELIRGVANVTLREKAGAITTDSLRTLTGPVDLGLHVARDGLSAMPLFKVASEDERLELIAALTTGYGALVLNSFPRSHTLPYGTTRRIQKDGDELAHALAGDAAVAASDLSGFIRTSLLILDEGNKCLQLGGRRVPTIDLTSDYATAIYASELLVHHNWNADHMEETALRVEFHCNLSRLSSYFAPWYLAPGRFEVDYTGQRRSDSGRRLTVKEAARLPRWPQPLSHVDVLGSPAFRHAPVEKMAQHFPVSSAPSFALLTYELPTGHRLVLDGNHRLAAALKQTQHGTAIGMPLVYVFVIAEGQHPPLTPGSTSAEGQRWQGFNPDVNLLRDLVAQR